MTDPITSWTNLWPEGLGEIGLSYFADSSNFDDSRLDAELGSRGLSLKKSASTSYGVFSGVDESEGFLASMHLLPADADSERRSVQLGIERRSDSRGLANLGRPGSVQGLLESVAGAYRGNTDDWPIFASARFTLSADTWENTLNLPVAVPAFGAVAGSTPHVEGFEFGYRDQASPLRRANISVDEDIGTTVWLMIREPAGDATTLMPRLCAALTNHLTLFATRISPSASEDVE